MSAQSPTVAGPKVEGRTGVHAVDEVFPAPRLLTLGLQHVLVMYAGAVAVPLVIGHALTDIGEARTQAALTSASAEHV